MIEYRFFYMWTSVWQVYHEYSHSYRFNLFIQDSLITIVIWITWFKWAKFFQNLSLVDMVRSHRYGWDLIEMSQLCRYVWVFFIRLKSLWYVNTIVNYIWYGLDLIHIGHIWACMGKTSLIWMRYHRYDISHILALYSPLHGPNIGRYVWDLQHVDVNSVW